MFFTQSIRFIKLPDGNWVNACRILLIQETGNVSGNKPSICVHLDGGLKHFLEPGDYETRRAWIKMILEAIAGGAAS